MAAALLRIERPSGGGRPGVGRLSASLPPSQSKERLEPRAGAELAVLLRAKRVPALTRRLRKR